jgi:hypothetical protein
MLTTKHLAEMQYIGRKTRTADPQPIYKPAAVIDYTNKMGGVDLSDQLMNYYHFLRRTNKWWRKLWVHLLNMVIMNAYVLNKAYGTSKINHNAYRILIAQHLLGVDSFDSPLDLHVPGPSHGHYPQRLAKSVNTDKVKTRRCVHCKATTNQKIRATTMQCSACQFALCIYPCFGQFHQNLFSLRQQGNAEPNNDQDNAEPINDQ